MKKYHQVVLISLALTVGAIAVIHRSVVPKPTPIPEPTYTTQPDTHIPAPTPTKAGSATLYPDPNLTPGDVLTTDEKTVCKSGYSATVRNVPVAEKRNVYAAYHIPYPQPQGTYEADHFISLELGGSNDIKNLWPEKAPDFHLKDSLENALHSLVCQGKMTLVNAQEIISTDWYKEYLTLGL